MSQQPGSYPVSYRAPSMGRGRGNLLQRLEERRQQQLQASQPQQPPQPPQDAQPQQQERPIEQVQPQPRPVGSPTRMGDLSREERTLLDRARILIARRQRREMLRQTGRDDVARALARVPVFVMILGAILLQIPLTTQAQEEQLNVPVAFKRIGSYAGGVKRGHLYLPLNLTEVTVAVEALTPEIEQIKHLFLGKLDFLSGPSQDQTKPASGILIAALQETLTDLDASYKRFSVLVRNPFRKSFAFTDEEEESSLKHFIKPTVTDGQTNHLGRKKRQVEFISLGLSLYNFYEITQLSSQVEAQGQDIKILKKTVEKTVHVTNALVETVNSYKLILVKNIFKLNNALLEVHRIEAYLQIDAHLQKIIREINLLTEGLGDLFKGQLNPYILNWPAIEAPLIDLHMKAEREHLKPLFSEWGWVLNSPFSFYIDNNILKLYIHIPYYSDNLYPLYHHMSFPFVSKEFQENGISLIIEPEQEYLAIDSKTKTGKTLSYKEFKSCTNFQLKKEKVYICEETAILNTDLDETCLGMLFMGFFTWADLEKYCDLKIAFPRPSYHILNENQIAYFFPTKTEIRLDCSNTSKIEVESKVGLNYKQVPSNCRFSAPGVLFIPEVNLEYEAKPWIFFPREVPFSHLSFDWKEAEQMMKSLAGEKRLEKISLDQFHHHKWNDVKHTAFWSTTFLVLGIIGVAVLVVIACFWKRRKEVWNLALDKVRRPTYRMPAPRNRMDERPRMREMESFTPSTRRTDGSTVDIREALDL